MSEKTRIMRVVVGGMSVPVALGLQKDTLARAVAGGEGVPVSSLLSKREKDLYRGLTVDKRRRDWLSGRLVAKLLLMDVLADEAPVPSQIEILPDEGKRPVPRIAGPKGGQDLPLCLSISHRGEAAGAAVLGVGQGRVGIDIEIMEPRSEELALSHFTATEMERIERLAPGARPWGIALFWSLKEAALKAAGVGLSVPATDVQVAELVEASQHGVMRLSGEAARWLGPDLGGMVRAPFTYLVLPPFIVSVAVIAAPPART